MDLTYIIIAGAGSLLQQYFSHEAQKKMEAYRRAAIKQEQDDMLAQSRALYEIRQKQDSEIHEAILRQQQKSNREAIINIANKTEQYTKWPLKVPPLCLRGTSSLLPDSLRSLDSKIPLYFMLAPGSNKDLNDKIPELEDYLEDFITKHFSVPGDNRIVMLRNCWLNPLKNCDEATARNIHSFIPDVPMVILYPSSTINGVDFECAFWNIAPLGLDDEGNVKYSYSFDSSIHLSDKPKIEFLRLCDSIAISITVLADLYGWGHFRCAPKLIKLAMESNFSHYPMKILEYYSSYTDILKNMVKNGLIDYEKECDAIINFCEAVDTPVEKAQAFEALQLVKGKDSFIEKLSLETQRKIWAYINNHYDNIYRQIGRKNLIYSFSVFDRKEVLTKILDQDDFSSKKILDEEIEEIITRFKDRFLKHVSRAKLQLLEQGRIHASNGVDVRNWFRPEMRKSINQIMEEVILPDMLSDISALLLQKYTLYIKNITGQPNIHQIRWTFINENGISNAHSLIADELSQRFKDSIIDRTDLNIYIKDNYWKNDSYSWINSVAQRWINYHMLSDDEVYTLSYIGESVSQKEDKDLYKDIKYSIQAYLKTFIRRLLGEPEPERNYSSSGSDSNPSYFDTVVMSPSY